MITQKEFEKVQVLISAPTEIRETGVDYTFKGLFRCGVCGSMLTAEKHEKLIKTTGKRKNFIYYKCNHKKRDVPCSEKTIAEPKIVSQIADKITKLELPQEVIDLVLQEVGSIKEQQAVTVKSQQLQRALVDFDQRIKTLIDHIAEERDTDIRQYMKVKINKLKIAKREVEEELTRETNRRSPFAELKDNLEVIKHSQRLFHHGTKNDKMRVLKVLGSNWNIASDIVDYKANFEARAVEKAQNFYLGGLANYRTEDNGSYMPNKLVQDTADFLWSG